MTRTAPKRYRDRHNDTWQELPDGRLALQTGPGHGPEGGPLSTICVYRRAEVERIDGPLTELTVVCVDPDCGAADCTGDHGLMRCPSTGQVNRNLATVADRWTCCGGLYPNHTTKG